MPLLVLTAQQRTVVMTDSENNHIKNVTELFDKCQNTCIQYIQVWEDENMFSLFGASLEY